MKALLSEISRCRLCAEALDHEPRPVLQANTGARLMIIGQAPGRMVQESGVPWDDASGDRLREWLNLAKPTFYGDSVALVPMGFCYPGAGKSGDLPPRPECAPIWHSKVVAAMPNVELTLLVGAYAQKHYLNHTKSTLTETVRCFQNYLPQYLPLPHPSPRNNIWLAKNPWFQQQVIPLLQNKMKEFGLSENYD